MTTTLSSAAGSITPKLILGWESIQESKTQTHPIIGAAKLDITIRPALKRSGTLRMLFNTETQANNCRNIHTAAGVITMVSTDLDHIDMKYVVTGDTHVQIADTMNHWIVSVVYQEV
jgi:hypothetical protein